MNDTTLGRFASRLAGFAAGVVAAGLSSAITYTFTVELGIIDTGLGIVLSPRAMPGDIIGALFDAILRSIPLALASMLFVFGPLGVGIWVGRLVSAVLRLAAGRGRQAWKRVVFESLGDL